MAHFHRPDRVSVSSGYVEKIGRLQPKLSTLPARSGSSRSRRCKRADFRALWHHAHGEKAARSQCHTVNDNRTSMYGGAERATVWAPVAGLYNALGFWPAVLFFPALGLFGITPMARKLRAVNATRSMITGPQ